MMPDKKTKPVEQESEPVPLPVIISEKQHSVPVVITAPDGVTPVPIPSLSAEANTVQGEDSPVAGYTPIPTSSATGMPLDAPQVTTTTIRTAPVPTTVAKGDDLTLTPTTTAADDKVTEGQRHINRVWEYSQSAIALMITAAIIYCAVNQITSDNLSNGFFLIIGFYFSRQNHQNTGGVGPKPDASVQSR